MIEWVKTRGSFVLGLALGAVVLVVFAAFSLTMVALHWFSLGLCRVGAHRAGCWIRRAVTTPALTEISKTADMIAEEARKRDPR